MVCSCLVQLLTNHCADPVHDADLRVSNASRS